MVELSDLLIKEKKPDSKPSLYGSKALVFPLCHVAARRLNVENNELIDSLLMVFFVFICQRTLSYNSVVHEVRNLAFVEYVPTGPQRQTAFRALYLTPSNQMTIPFHSSPAVLNKSKEYSHTNAYFNVLFSTLFPFLI